MYYHDYFTIAEFLKQKGLIDNKTYVGHFWYGLSPHLQKILEEKLSSKIRTDQRDNSDDDNSDYNSIITQVMMKIIIARDAILRRRSVRGLHVRSNSRRA